MEGVIMSFRRSIKNQSENQMIIQVNGVDTKEKAEKLVGKTVSWHAPGKLKKALKGKIAAPHGRKGVVRAIFECGMPGQSLAQKVKIE